MDDFKKYIIEHRHQLDKDEPGDHVFAAVERRLRPANKVAIMAVKWAVAACVILLVGLAVYIFGVDKEDELLAGTRAGQPVITDSSTGPKPVENEDVKRSNNQDVIADVTTDNKEKWVPKNYSARLKKSTNTKIVAAPIDPMFKAFSDMDKSYTSMVSLQLEKVKGTPIYAEDAGYFHVFKKQFQDLTNDEKVLKEETKKYGINDDIITRMINIYQEKISLLKQLQFEINKMNNRVKNSNSEIQQKLNPTYIHL